MIVDICRMAFSKSIFTKDAATDRAKQFDLPIFYETEEEFIFEDEPNELLLKKQFRKLEDGLEIELALKMKLEEMTPSHLHEASDDEVRQAWHRLNQWYAVAKRDGHAVEDYVNAGIFVMAEFAKRGFDIDKTGDLAKAIEEFQKPKKTFDMRSLIEGLPENDLVVVKDFISVVGSSVIKDNPHDLDVLFRANRVDNNALIQSENMWLPIRKALDPNKDGYLQFVWNPQGPHADHIPLYDLVLRRRESFGTEAVKSMREKLAPMETFDPPKPAVKKFTELFSVDELWPWAEKHLPIDVEIKFNGFRAVTEKKGDRMSLWFEGTPRDNKISVLTAIRDVIARIGDPFILDGDLGILKNGKRLPRAALAKFNSQDFKLEPDEKLFYAVFDLPYWTSDIHKLDFVDRRKKLEEFYHKYLAGHDVFHLSEVRWCNNKEEIQKAGTWASDQWMSEGLVAKAAHDGGYKLDGETDTWSKVKHVTEFKVIVFKKTVAANGQYSYRAGLLASDESFKNTIEWHGKKYVDMGNTLNSSVPAQEGDIITITVQELVVDHPDDLLSWESATVTDVDKTRSTPYYVNQAIDIARRGHTLQELKSLSESQQKDLQEDETRGDVAISVWKERWQELLPKSGKGKFVYHHHWRGLSEEETKLDEAALLKTDHSVHGDLRLEGNETLWGFTCFLGTTADVRGAGGDRLKPLKSDDSLEGTFKMPQPKEWLMVGRPSPYVSKPTEVGATSQAYAKFFAEDYGTYQMGSAREHFFEIFLHGNKGLKGRYLIEFAPVGGSRKWLIKKAPNETPYAEENKLDAVVKELKGKGQKWLYWNVPGGTPRLIDVDKYQSDEST